MPTRIGLLLVLLLSAGAPAHAQSSKAARQADLQRKLSFIPQRLNEAQRTLERAKKQDDLELKLCLQRKRPRCMNPGTFSNTKVAQMQLRTVQRDQMQFEQQSKSLQK